MSKTPRKGTWDEEMGCYKVPLTGGAVALIDMSDYHLVSGFCWCKDDNGYAVRGTNKWRRPPMQEAILGRMPGLWVDHINRDRLDNRRRNFRHVTPAQNNLNRRSCAKSGLKGVSRVSNSNGLQWRAHIKINGKFVHLGCYTTPEEAALVYNEAAKKNFGELAYQNKIEREGKEG